ncbi:MAG TPA: hypothetical protein VFA70_03920 [Dehalococcoidia bacterium]|nr:hypothetical protein [Dehalococcoidia bacterium]
MRPTVPELVRGISATLSAGVIPALQDPWLQAEVRYSLGVLETVALEWDGAADRLVRENDALQRFATFAAALGDEQRGALPEPLMAGLTEAATLPPAPDLRLTTLMERNAALWNAVIPLIELLGAESLPRPLAGQLQAEAAPLLRRHAAEHQLRRR